MQEQGIRERILQLEGGNNFRDLGGYPTTNGGVVRWRHLFRSGSMDRLSEKDFEKLDRIGLRAICDFRSSEERDKAPTRWDRLTDARYWSRNYEHSIGDLYRLLASEDVTLEEARSVMSDIYRGLPSEQAAAYRELFTMLSRNEVPVVFNCTAGKDRTGLAAALVLAALGVSYDLIIEDYELSNHAFDYRAAENDPAIKLSPEVIHALGGTHPDYLDAAWSTITDSYGDPLNYIIQQLGITHEMLDSIRGNLLE